jgi:hypothetical protein
VLSFSGEFILLSLQRRKVSPIIIESSAANLAASAPISVRNEKQTSLVEKWCCMSAGMGWRK